MIKRRLHGGGVPDAGLNAIVAYEDPRFYQEPPQFSQITKLNAKYMLIYSSTSIVRKAAVFSLKYLIPRTLSHDEILNWYVQTMYLGQNCFGLEQAAKVYYGKELVSVELHEFAYLAALQRKPSSLHPLTNYDEAIKQRNHVLAEMALAGFITEIDAVASSQEKLVIVEPLGTCKQMLLPLQWRPNAD